MLWAPAGQPRIVEEREEEGEHGKDEMPRGVEEVTRCDGGGRPFRKKERCPKFRGGRPSQILQINSSGKRQLMAVMEAVQNDEKIKGCNGADHDSRALAEKGQH